MRASLTLIPIRIKRTGNCRHISLSCTMKRLIILLAVLTSCVSAPDPQPQPSANVSIVGTWNLKSYPSISDQLYGVDTTDLWQRWTFSNDGLLTIEYEDGVDVNNWEYSTNGSYYDEDSEALFGEPMRIYGGSLLESDTYYVDTLDATSLTLISRRNRTFQRVL